jgi:hypothetical protein
VRLASLGVTFLYLGASATSALMVVVTY